MNAGVMYEKAKQPEEAADVYLELAREVRRQSAETRREGRVLRGVRSTRRSSSTTAPRRRTSSSSRSSATRHARPPTRCSTPACCARRSARTRTRSRTTRSTRSSYRERKDAPDVAFNIGVVYEDAGEEGPAYQAFADYARDVPLDGKRVDRGAHARRPHVAQARPAQAREGRASRPRRALYKRANGEEKAAGKPWAAEARYYEGELIFREYEKVTLDVKPAKLEKALKTEEQAARRGREGLLVGRRLQGSQVGDRGAVPHRPGLRRVRRVARQRVDAEGPAAGPGAGVPRRARRRTSSTSRTRRSSCSPPATRRRSRCRSTTSTPRRSARRSAASPATSSRRSASRAASERIGDRPPNPELVTEVAR